MQVCVCIYLRVQIVLVINDLSYDFLTCLSLCHEVEIGDYLIIIINPHPASFLTFTYC